MQVVFIKLLDCKTLMAAVRGRRDGHGPAGEAYRVLSGALRFVKKPIAANRGFDHSGPAARRLAKTFHK